MTANQETIISHVLMQVKPDTIIDEATIKGYINVFKVLNPITAEEEEEFDIAEITGNIKAIDSDIKQASDELKKQFKELGLEFPF